MTLKELIDKKAKNAKDASKVLSCISLDDRNNALINMAKHLKESSAFIIRANKKDIASAKRSGLSKAMIDRLTLNSKRIEEMAESIKAVAKLPDPCGVIDRMWKRPNGLIIAKMRVPIGVIGIIYESRPNVTSDCAALCLKSGNAVILKGGKESINSNLAIHKVLQDALRKTSLNPDSISIIESTDRKAVSYLLKLDKYIDLIIPRGGEIKDTCHNAL